MWRVRAAAGENGFRDGRHKIPFAAATAAARGVLSVADAGAGPHSRASSVAKARGRDRFQSLGFNLKAASKDTLDTVSNGWTRSAVPHLVAEWDWRGIDRGNSSRWPLLLFLRRRWLRQEFDQCGHADLKSGAPVGRVVAAGRFVEGVLDAQSLHLFRQLAVVGAQFVAEPAAEPKAHPFVLDILDVGLQRTVRPILGVLLIPSQDVRQFPVGSGVDIALQIGTAGDAAGGDE